MSKSIKFKNNVFLDSSGVTHNKKLLKDILGNFQDGNTVLYHPSDMSAMSSGATSKILDVDRTHLFHTDWTQYSSYDSRFAGCLGIYLKGGGTSTGGVAIIFFYAGSIGVNVRIDNNRWGGWQWIN